MAYLTTPSVLLSPTSTTSFTALVTGDATATHRLYYRLVGSAAAWTPGPTGVGVPDTLAVASLQEQAAYEVYVVNDDLVSAYSQPWVGAISLATPDTLAQAMQAYFATRPELVAALTGGMWTGEVPEGTDPPYAWLDTPLVRSSYQFETELLPGTAAIHVLGFGASAAEATAAVVKAAYDDCTLTFATPSKYPVSCVPRSYRLADEYVRWKDGRRVYRVVLVYDVLAERYRY